MYDILPFPRLTSDNATGQISEIVNYLVMFKEAVEFALSNISAENLSPDLIQKLDELGLNIERSKAENDETVTQLSKNNITIPDVCNSELFKKAVGNEVSGITFSVNFNTGYLEYDTKGD